MEKEGVDDAYEISRGKGTKILVINSGADCEHPEIKDGFLGGFNYQEENEDVSDKNGHGTRILGIIAGKTIGIAPFSKCYVLKVRDDEIGFSPIKNVKMSLVDWLDRDVDVINISIGKSEYDEDLEKLCKLAHYKKGKLIVSAAGKTATGPTFPSSYTEVISVGAVDLKGKHREFSNIWPTLDISAPGKDIFTTNINNKNNYNLAYVLCGGTSMATPHVTAILGLAVSYLKHKNIRLSPRELELLIKKSANPPAYDQREIKKIIKNYRFDLANKNITPSQFVKYMYGEGIIRTDNFIKEVILYTRQKP